MNKTILVSALFTGWVVAHAAPVSPTSPTSTSTATVPAVPAENSGASPGASSGASTGVSSGASTGVSSGASSSVPAPQAPPTINCHYPIAPDTTKIEESVISTWAGKAVVQSFDFNPATVDDQLTELKACYTDQGWQGFNDALQKSGNVTAIKSQHLNVSAQVDGEVKVAVVKDNQWKVTVPLQVVYQNDKEKLTQQLTIDLLIGRKTSGNLGIMQMIASPKKAEGATPAPASAPSQPAASTGTEIPATAPASPTYQLKTTPAANGPGSKQ